MNPIQHRNKDQNQSVMSEVIGNLNVNDPSDLIKEEIIVLSDSDEKSLTDNELLPLEIIRATSTAL